MPAYREALLLRHRLDWAGILHGIELRSERTGHPVTFDLPMLEDLTPWDDEDCVMPLVEGGILLEDLWAEVCLIFKDSPTWQVSVDSLAPLIPVSRDLWDQWIHRGRRRIQERLGADYSRVFAVWDNQGEGV